MKVIRDGNTPREEAERAAFHAFLEDALETAAVSGISADLSIGGARMVESLTGRDGSGQTENGSGNTLPGTDIKFLLPTYQEMVAELESIGMSREEAETEILTITREVGEELGIGGTLTNGGIMEAEIFTQIQTLPQEGSSPKTDNPTPYFTSDIWTGELEDLWTETQTDLNMDVLTEGDVDPDIGENSALDLDTEPLRHEDVLQQYLEKDPTLSAGDIPSIADLNVDSVTDMEVVPKTKEQLISELAPKIQKTGITPGRASIAAQEMYAEAEKWYGSNADAVLEMFQPGQDPRKYLYGFRNAYIAGKLGNKAALENSTAAAYLTENQRRVAYALGNLAGNVSARESLDIVHNNSTMESDDLWIGKSLGAKAKNYEIELPNGEIVHLTEGTRITRIETIAGKGRNRQIDEIDILLERYGGSEFEWMKKKGNGYVDYQGESYFVELHWYEEPSAGKHKWKVKADKDGNWFIYED